MAGERAVESELPGDPGRPPARRLAGKVAIVTGAGSQPGGVGVGKATSIVFGREGARLALVDAQPERAEETRREVEAAGGEALVVEANVADDDSCRRAVERVVAAFGGLDILVNNVGITGPAGTAADLDPVEFDRAMHVNLTSMVLMARYAVPSMAARGGGAIVNLSSVAGLLGGHPSLLYPVSKSAVVGLTRSMAAHHGRQGIRVNCIAPGRIYTPMVATRGMTSEMREARRLFSPLQTEGTAWDIANAALFLCGAESRWITGIVLSVDAGESAALCRLPGQLSPEAVAFVPGSVEQ